MSLIGSGVLSRVVSDGMISKKRVSQAGPREAFAFRANRYCSKRRDLGYGASLCSCAFVIVTCFKGRHPLPVQEREVRVNFSAVVPPGDIWQCLQPLWVAPPWVRVVLASSG